MLHTINNFVHVGIGTLGLLGGAIALLAVKGSDWHVRGKVFAWSMAAVVVTTLITMLDGLLPLAVVLALAEAYLVVPLAVATLAILWVYRRYPVASRPTSAETGAGSFG